VQIIIKLTIGGNAVACINDVTTFVSETMTIPIIGKVVITTITLAVAAGMATVIYFIVTDEGPDIPVVTPDPITTTTEEPGDTEYRVGVGIADMTGPCAEIAFVSILTFNYN
jgi:hypothetical protein